MKITRVEAIYLRQPEVKEQCDSGQDALIVRVETDAGITGIGEVDSNPLGAKGLAELALVGVAAAVANAVYHATGKRIRDLPITSDKLL